MKKLFAILMLGVAMQASAVELDGAKFEDKAKVGGSELVLNGAGIRSAVFWDVYAAGLYLGEKKHTAEAVLGDAGAKRIELYVMKDNDADHFVDSLRKGIAKNYDAQQAAAFEARLAELGKMFGDIDEFEEDDVLNLDWVPGQGTLVSLNGKELGKIDGADFYTALLSIWIGKEPAKDKLKKELLGA